jgi:hypothetical protein
MEIMMRKTWPLSQTVDRLFARNTSTPVASDPEMRTVIPSVMQACEKRTITNQP